jgi:hypothetical protein
VSVAEDIIKDALAETQRKLELGNNAIRQFDETGDVWTLKDADAHIFPGFRADGLQSDMEWRNAVLRDIEELRTELRVLETKNARIAFYHRQNKMQFAAIEQRDNAASRQNLWLSLGTSTLTLIIGWLLSLLATPAAVLQMIGR